MSSPSIREEDVALRTDRTVPARSEEAVAPGAATPAVTVTLVTYECRDDVLRCIGTLGAAAARHDVQVVVVDNDSTDGVAEVVRRQHPDVLVVERRTNAGFGSSHNLAAAHARGRYLLVLNPDTEVAPGAIDAMVDFADAKAAEGTPIGVVAPMLLNPDGTDQMTARSFPTASAGIFGRRSPLTRWFPNNPWSRRFLRADQVDRSRPWTVDWVSGAAMLVPRDLFESLGGFDPEFFMHFEDAELCARVGAMGREVWCVPQARIVHSEGGSRGGWPASQVWYFHRGAYLFARKARYPDAADPRRWLTAVLLGVRLIATILLNMVQRITHVRQPAGSVDPQT
ncbi:MAG: glycosyltransferase family 2 protein [Actinobacteria bacterium]|nr:glycosyltransferase family 2 protein [Actinomycetota bacterium]